MAGSIFEHLNFSVSQKIVVSLITFFEKLSAIIEALQRHVFLISHLANILFIKNNNKPVEIVAIPLCQA